MDSTHFMDLGAAGKVSLRLTFSENEILAVMNIPAGLNRRNRRFVSRWSQQIFKGLDGDEREIRVTAMTAGRVVAIGAERNGVGVVLSE